jgi:hypothetical protein
MAYDKPLPKEYFDPENGDVCLMTRDEFLEAMHEGCFSDDGIGHPVKDGMADESVAIDPPSAEFVPPSATHVVWYPK